MTLCQSRGELGGARHRDEQVQWTFWCLVRPTRFYPSFAPATRFAGCFKVQAHCLALESSPLDHQTREKFGEEQKA
jgi:hypothetical protein